MQLALGDWLAIAAYFAITIGISLRYRRRASKSLEEFFVSGRSVSWWLAGTSMVATTFAADTPLAVAGMVATGGIAGNWLWWNFALSGLLTTFFFARLWRRSGVLTDVEFAELRYAGKPAAFLRGFRAVYLAIPINCIVIGWVNLAMVKVLGLTLGVDKVTAILIVLGLTALTGLLSSLSGLRGVLVTDLVQFVLMMSMAVLLAVFAVEAVGGLGALTAKLEALDRPGSPLAMFPEPNSAWMPFLTFAVYLSVVWWSTWYPGSEPGGGGFVAQRMLSTSSERDAVFATLWFNVAHYAIRSWPWILVGLVALTAFPGLEDPETGYIQAMFAYLPASMRGLMLAGFIAAFMSTVSTNLNWGASYLVNDVYRRFLRPDATEEDLIRVSRWATIGLALAAAGVTFFVESVAGAWKLLLATGAGTGGVLLLRWFWWRVNAWSEVAAMAAAAVISLTLQLGFGYDTDRPLDFAHVMLLTVAGTTAIWVAVTYLTKPEPEATLTAFYRLARPFPALWGPIARLAPEVRTPDSFRRGAAGFAGSLALIYGALFGVGNLLFGDWTTAALLLAVSVCGGVVVAKALRTPRT